MHTFCGKDGTRIHYSTGLCGDVIIQKGDKQVVIDGEDFLNFLADELSDRVVHWAEEFDFSSVLLKSR